MKNKKRKRTNTKAEESQYLFSADNSIGEHMFVCLNCGGPINGSQAAKYYYYLCANYKNKGVAGCAKGIYLGKDEVERKVIASLNRSSTR